MDSRKCRTKTSQTIIIVLTIVLCGPFAKAQYGGGTGGPNDPYLIYTAEQMNAIGAEPNDWDKHFLLCADLDLSAYTRTEFNLIGNDQRPFQGVFDGNHHVISNFTYDVADSNQIGLFGCVEDPNAEIRNLGLANSKIYASESLGVGSLVGHLRSGTISGCYITGGEITGYALVGGLIGRSEGQIVESQTQSIRIRGEQNIGGLVGLNEGRVRACRASGAVKGGGNIGGLVGASAEMFPGDRLVFRSSLCGELFDCHFTGSVIGQGSVGGLVGYSTSHLTQCHADGIVQGNNVDVGGLVGEHDYGTLGTCYSTASVFGETCSGGLIGWIAGGSVVNCYATGNVLGDEYCGGLVGYCSADLTNTYASGRVIGSTYTGGLSGNYWADEKESFWDIQSSGQQERQFEAGLGKTTAQMQTIGTFLTWGESDNAGVWTIDEGKGYPRLAWENRPGAVIGAAVFSDLFDGSGTQDDPYLVRTPGQLYLIGRFPDQWDKHYEMTADIDLAAFANDVFHIIGTSSNPFSGTFDGDYHTISNMILIDLSSDSDYIGLFGYVSGPQAEIRNVGLCNPHIDAREISHYANPATGALVAYFAGRTITNCHVDGGLILGTGQVGGLVGYLVDANMTECHSTATVLGYDTFGGLVGCVQEGGLVENCYATGNVLGYEIAGGLIGLSRGTVRNCYATGTIAGTIATGGLLLGSGEVIASFWNVQTTVQDRTNGSEIGLTTAELQKAETFLAAGWDFVDETANGTEDIWWILEGQDYPRLRWEMNR